MALYQLILAYDGTCYLGFQRQGRGATVQAAVEQALHQIGWQGRSLLAAGRTDTGVHASGQVVAFDLDWAHSPRELVAALNANLPADIAVQSAIVAPDGFHPRYSAQARRYQYHVTCLSQRSPLAERYAWRVWPALELEQMQAAAKALLGRHDFAGFGAPMRRGGSTVRTVFQASWQTEPGDPPGSRLCFEITADAFLYHMVRRLVQGMVEIGHGRQPVQAFAMLLERPPQLPLQGLAPPQGLVLAEVYYRPWGAGED